MVSLGLITTDLVDDMMEITGWWQMVQECLSCFMIVPSDVSPNPAILPLQALELCSTIGQLQLSFWDFCIEILSPGQSLTS